MVKTIWKMYVTNVVFSSKCCSDVDIIALSCDSFNDEINKELGRGTGKHVEIV